jgi:Asp-tRNA(Asn)/Glu-tRNA(Gln) amidotransferase A subunit family amidase
VAVGKAAGVNRVGFPRVSAGSAVLDLEVTPAGSSGGAAAAVASDAIVAAT